MKFNQVWAAQFNTIQQTRLGWIKIRLLTIFLFISDIPFRRIFKFSL